MGLVEYEQTAMPVFEEGTGMIKFSPAIRFGGKGDFIPISHRGNVLVYDTAEEAEAYFND